ncbi:MAG: hypothetical protein FWJ72_08570 [Acidimicrobiia bacterium]|jgi:hypothetical protein
MARGRHDTAPGVGDRPRRRVGQTAGVTDETTGPLPDGTYDAFVVDTATRDDGSVAVDLTIVAGEAKGRVVTVRTSSLAGDPLDLLGVPATITVEGGRPSVRFEP